MPRRATRKSATPRRRRNRSAPAPSCVGAPRPIHMPIHIPMPIHIFFSHANSHTRFHGYLGVVVTIEEQGGAAPLGGDTLGHVEFVRQSSAFELVCGKHSRRS